MLPFVVNGSLFYEDDENVQVREAKCPLTADSLCRGAREKPIDYEALFLLSSGDTRRIRDVKRIISTQDGY